MVNGTDDGGVVNTLDADADARIRA